MYDIKPLYKAQNFSSIFIVNTEIIRFKNINMHQIIVRFLVYFSTFGLNSPSIAFANFWMIVSFANNDEKKITNIKEFAITG